MNEIHIGIAAHKEYNMPEDPAYFPIQVGAKGKETIKDYIRDDSSDDNISELNPNFCELTATYHIWKNVEAKYKGLVHYRRHFSMSSSSSDFKQGKFNQIASSDYLLNILKNTDIIVPNKRKYYIETLYSHYKNSHNAKDLDETRRIIEEIYPEYIESYDEVMNRTYAHMFNMYIMKADKFDEYAEWMFDILFELRNRIDISSYNTQEARVFGYISELLLDVWLEKNHIEYSEIPVMFMEKQNWMKKGSDFIVRKLRRD